MADKDKGSVEIDVVVDASEAVDGFKKAGDAAESMAKELEKADKAIDDAGKASEDLGKEMVGLGKSMGDQPGLIDDMKKRLTGLSSEYDEARESAERLGQEIEDLPVREAPGKPIGDSLPDDNDIDQLGRFRDVTGEADSALAGMAAATDHVSPELAGMMRVVGDTAGFMEAASRGTALFGGSLGTLIRIGAPVAIAAGAMAFAYSKFSAGLEEAEEKLKDTHDEMVEGIAKAKAYAARMDATRVVLGLMTQQQADYNEAVRRAEEGNTILEGQIDRTREKLSFLRVTQAHNVAEQNRLREGSDNLTVSLGSVQTATISASNALTDQNAELVTANHTFDSASNARLNLLTRTEELEAAILDEEVALAQLNAQRDSEIAKFEIEAALRTGEISQIEEAAFRINDLDIAIQDKVRAQVRSTLETLRAADAAEAEANALEDASKATEDRTKSIEEQFNARMNLNRMLAGSTDRLTQIELDYVQAIKDAQDAIEAAGGTEGEHTQLLQNAIQNRTEAIDEYHNSQEESVNKQAASLERTLVLEKSLTDQIQSEYDNRMADLIRAHDTKQITTKQFHEQEVLAEERKEDKLMALRQQKAQAALTNVAQFGNVFMGMIQSNIDLVNTKMDQEEEAALARVGDSAEEREKVEKDFDRKRSKALSAAYKKRQALEIANATISGASAVIAALAPPPIGAGPIAGLFLGAGIVATTAAQIATIQAQTPKFHEGGIVGGDGDQPITAQGGEVVLNREAVSELGGAEAADMLNNGSAPGGVTVVQMTYKQRVFDQIVLDNLAKGGPLKTAINDASKNGRRGRVGGRL